MHRKGLFPDPSKNPLRLEDALDIDALFHRLNNQLGIILANAELLESKLSEEKTRVRAGQIVVGAIEAIAAVRDIRTRSK
jgi:hypothetical protein